MTPAYNRCVIAPFILCGSFEAQLWPAVRDSIPSQFLQFVDHKSLTLQTVAQRAADMSVSARPTVIAPVESYSMVAEQLAKAGVAADIVLEPNQRGTAATFAVAALHAARQGPETIALFVPVEHLIGDPSAFKEAIRRAVAGAQLGRIMTLGITPEWPAIDCDYIRVGTSVLDVPGIRQVENFIDKPDIAWARRLFDEGALWNSGYYLFRADVMLGEFEVYEPQILAAASLALDGAAVDANIIRLDPAAFSHAPIASIDYSILRRTIRAGAVTVG